MRSVALSRLSDFKSQQTKRSDTQLNDFLRIAIPYVAKNYPGNTIERSREAAMLWIRVFKLGLIRGDVLWSFDANNNLSSLFLVRPVLCDKLKPLDPFDVADNGTLLVIDVGIITDQSAREPVLDMLDVHRKNQCTHFAWVRQGDQNTLMVIERNKFKRMGVLSTKLNFNKKQTKKD